MSNQAKRLSDCPAERLAQCRGEAVPPSGVAVECAICASLGDQCVTCEEAEFAVWADRHFAAADYRQTTAGVFVQDWMRHSFSAWQARSAHITRLQAEVSALQQRLNIADQHVSDLEVEVAKLRRGPCELIYGDELPNQGIPGTSFQRLNALANKGE
jgi:hypothetical protein